MANKSKPKSVRTQTTTARSFVKLKKPKLNTWFSLASIVTIAAVGVYMLFFAHAADLGCNQPPDASAGQEVCDVTQVSRADDSYASSDRGSTDGLLANGWAQVNWNTAFRAPNYPKNGALPVFRYWRPDISAHFLAIDGSATNLEYIRDVYEDALNPAWHNPGAHYRREGIAFYAWPDGREPGTVPIQRIDRGPTYFLALYFDNRQIPDSIINGDHSYTYHTNGSEFWAYPANYVVPLPPTTPTKDAPGCDTKKLVPGDKGNCVTTLKHYLNVDTAGKAGLNESDNTFDGNTSNAVRFVSTNLKNAGVPGVDSYSNVVTQGIWNALAGITKAPAAPAAAAPAASIVTTLDCAVYANFVTDACKAARDAVIKKASTKDASTPASGPKKIGNTAVNTTGVRIPGTNIHLGGSNNGPPRGSARISTGNGGTIDVAAPAQKSYSKDPCPYWGDILKNNGHGSDGLKYHWLCIAGVQNMIKCAGVLIDGQPIKVDGDWGDQTRKGLQLFATNVGAELWLQNGSMQTKNAISCIPSTSTSAPETAVAPPPKVKTILDVISADSSMSHHVEVCDYSSEYAPCTSNNVKLRAICVLHFYQDPAITPRWTYYFPSDKQSQTATGGQPTTLSYGYIANGSDQGRIGKDQSCTTLNGKDSGNWHNGLWLPQTERTKEQSFWEPFITKQIRTDYHDLANIEQYKGQ